MKFNFFTFFFPLFLFFALYSCKNRTIDQLRPETVEFLTNQETARCACLDLYGKEFIRKMDKGILHIKGLSKRYNLKKLTQAKVYTIRLELVSYMSIIKTVTACIGEKTPPVDQFMGMFIQEDLKVVLGIDSSMTEQEQLRLMNKPSLELLDDLCPKHKEAVLKLQELLDAGQELPPSLL